MKTILAIIGFIINLFRRKPVPVDDKIKWDSYKETKKYVERLKELHNELDKRKKLAEDAKNKWMGLITHGADDSDIAVAESEYRRMHRNLTAASNAVQAWRCRRPSTR